MGAPRTEAGLSIWDKIAEADRQAKLNALGEIAKPAMDDVSTPLPYYPGFIVGREGSMTPEQWVERAKDSASHGGWAGEHIRNTGLSPEQILDNKSPWAKLLIKTAIDKRREAEKK